METEKGSLKNTAEEICRLVRVMQKLRAPDGCPWDKVQTHETLMPFIMEECGEFLDAVAAKDDANMREELGDVLMQVVLHSVIAEERGKFDFCDVVHDITEKMIFRHPHVFSTAHVKDAGEVLQQWDKLKAQEKNHARGPSKSLLDGVPCHAPALLQAEKIQKKAAKVGFDWSSQKEILDKIGEEYQELRSAMESGEDEAHIDEELGDLLFAAANLSRFRKRRSAEILLADANAKFKRRFRYIENALAASGRKFEECSLKELDALWNEAKKQEKSLQ